MDHTTTGTVHGNTIVLDQPPPGMEGQAVEVTVRQAQVKAMEQIYQERKLERRDPFADDANAMSSQRPMSDEERAELERVYQDRGCSTECDG